MVIVPNVLVLCMKHLCRTRDCNRDKVRLCYVVISRVRLLVNSMITRRNHCFRLNISDLGEDRNLPETITAVGSQFHPQHTFAAASTS